MEFNQSFFQQKLKSGIEFFNKNKLDEANKGTAPESIKTEIDALNKIWASATEKMYQETASQNQNPNESQDESTSSNDKMKEDSNIEDADFEVVDESEDK